jgi:3-hydroxybutyryl-CoA dehydrogenase
MGAAAAVCFKRSGYETILWDNDRKRLDTVQDQLSKLEAWLDKHVGPAPVDGGEYRKGSLRSIDHEADLVMDCIVEEMDPKVGLFRSLPEAIKRRAVFITTTSGLSITELGRQSGTSHLLAGTHFWNPPHLMPLVEVVRGEDTPDQIVDQVTEVVRSIGKIPVRVNRDVPGFIGNRLLHAMWREAIYLVQEGIAAPEDVDLVSRLTFGLRMPAVGPLENMDLVGLDLIERIHDYLLADLSSTKKPLQGLTDRIKRDHLGMKTGRGFYDWEHRDGGELIAKRDAQIVNQLEFLKKLDADS